VTDTFDRFAGLDEVIHEEWVRRRQTLAKAIEDAQHLKNSDASIDDVCEAAARFTQTQNMKRDLRKMRAGEALDE